MKIIKRIICAIRGHKLWLYDYAVFDTATTENSNKDARVYVCKRCGELHIWRVGNGV